MSLFERRRLLCLAFILACSFSWAACTGPPAASDRASNPPGSPSSGSPVPSTAHDGSTILPSSQVSSCDVLGQDRIRAVLGDAAAAIQPSEYSGSVDPSGVRRESCIYPLDSGRTTTHAVVMETTTFASADALAGSAPFAPMQNPVDVPDLPGQAKFATVELSGSTEYVLAIANGPKLTRLIVSRPSSSWSSADALAALKQLAKSDNS